MFATLIKYLKLGYELLISDPADKEHIQELQAQVAELQSQLATSQANDPTPDEQAEINDLLAKFAAATPPEPTPEPEAEAETQA